jgi:pyochelin synthetase
VSVSDLVAELESLGVRLWEEDGRLRFRAPASVMTEQRREALRAAKDQVLAHLRDDASLLVVAEPERRHDPFPLTDVQAAYLLGRRDVFAYGGTACHGYGELTFPDLDVSRLEAAVDALVRRHDMLRAVVDDDGFQRVLPEVPAYRVAVADLRGGTAAEAEAAIEATRAELDHKVHPAGRWPLFEMRVTRAPERAVLHFSIDFLVADFVSISIILDELHRLYADPSATLPEIGLTFRDYLAAECRVRSGSRYDRDRAYWTDHVDDLPPAPDLPVFDSEAPGGPVRFGRWAARLDAREWAALRQRAGARGVTPSGAVLAAYAEVVGRWSRHPGFTLDLTLLNRLPVHPHVDRLVGDFTSISLVAVDPTAGELFADRATAVQEQLFANLDHRLYSGVEVLRELGRRRGADAALMPVVFTSAIGLGDGGGPAGVPRGELGYGISQTPQVWIDCQNIERDGGLATNWDVRLGVFPDGLVDDMFAAYVSLLHRLAAGEEAWEETDPVELPAAQAERRRAVNDTAAALPDGLLHERVLAQARRAGERTAVVAADRTLTYAELAGSAAAVAVELAERGVRSGDLVGVVMRKGWEQIAGVLGVLAAGAAYVPVDAIQPPLRREQMLRDAGVRLVLTQSALAGEPWPESVTTVEVDTLPPRDPDGLPPVPTRPDDLAYVIYTSGSTGRPKGVMITHRGALNTIVDVDSRFGVTADDRVLGLANLGFDLSVYDIFGPLALGGSIVLPDPDRRGDPSHWAQLAAEHEVTLWNSVPAQLQMLDDYLTTTPSADLPSLRLAMLSGDWIAVGLPDHVRGRLPGLRVVSLGGATEASIWSIAFPIGTVDSRWRSIPYGRPLANQTFAVLDAGLRPCPDWVTGELYIGGAGLAVGYLGDQRRTAERFVRDPRTGERLYRTGDLGRYLPSGDIEFLGREDFQVKIRGHRIELAEVEAVLASHPAVGSATVVVDGDRPMERRLVAFAEPARRETLDGGDVVSKELVEAAVAAAARVRREVDPELVVAFAAQLDETALSAMVHTLQSLGLFATTADRHTVDEVMSIARVTPKHERLIRRWLGGLEQHGFVARDGDGRYRRLRDVTAADVEQAWAEVDRLQRVVRHGEELIRYFRVATEHLPELMHEDVDPIQLLFPEGRLEIHEAAYKENFLGRYLNRVASTAIRKLAAANRTGRPLRVLEVGAGVGGTSMDVVPELSAYDAEYLFTDVSQFFLNKAAERFAEYPWVSYGIYDFNADYRVQGLAPNTFDVVLCANVMHYARHAGRALESLRELLRPGGSLVFIETTRDNYQILTSMEFLFDATNGDFEDVRHGRDQTFVTREQWLDLLVEAGAVPTLVLPDTDDVLSRIGMFAFVARMKTDREPVDAAELVTYAGERLPEYMLPARMEIVDAVPLSANGKVDRAGLRSWLEARPAARAVPGGGSEPVGELEQRLAAIWGAVLRLDRVARDVDFFALGGDSLLAAQVVGQVREHMPEASGFFFDALLREVLQGATVGSLAAHLTDAVGPGSLAGTTGPAGGSPLVPLGGDGDGAAYVLVPAAGLLDPLGPLVERLAGHAPVVGLTVGSAAEFLETAPARMVEQVAASYVRHLLTDGYWQARLVGFGAGGVLAAEIARQLVEMGGDTVSLTVVGAPPSGAADDDVLADRLFARDLGLDPEELDLPPDAGQRLARIAAAAGLDPAAAESRRALHRHAWRSASVYDMSPYLGDVTLVRATRSAPWPGEAADAERYWADACLGTLTLVDVDAAVVGADDLVAVLTGDVAR